MPRRPHPADPDTRAPVPPRRLRVPISTALVVGFGGLTLVALVTVMAIGLGVAGRNTLGLLVDKAALTLDLVTLRVEARMEPVGDQAAFLAGEIAGGTLSPERPAELASALRLALAATPQVTGIAFTGPDYRTVRVGRFGAGYETMIGDAREVEDLAILERFLAEAQARRAPFWADPFWQPQLDATLVPLVQPVWQGDRFVGAIGTGVSLAELSRFLDDLFVDTGTVAFLRYDRDHLVAHPALTRLDLDFSGTRDGPPLPRIEDIGDPVLTRILRQGEIAGGDAETPIEELTAATRGISVVEPPGDGPPDHIVLLRSTPAYGSRPWQAGVLLEQTDFADELGRFAVALGASVAVLVVAVAAALALGLPISRRVGRLSEAAARLAELDFGHVRPLRDSRFRELAEASAAFNAMTRGLKWFESYVPKPLVLRLIRRHGDAGVASEERAMTVMFTDLRGFTTLTQALSAADTADLLNAHFALLAQAIEAEGGIVDKFIGDGIMAFWGAPEDQPDHAARALRAACAIARAVAADNTRRRAEGLPPLGLRIGLHSGPMVVGNIGPETRLNYTVVGEPVNVAARIEELGKSVAPGDDIVVLASAAVIAAAGADAQGAVEGTTSSALGPCHLRGLDEPMGVVRLTVHDTGRPSPADGAPTTPPPGA